MAGADWLRALSAGAEGQVAARFCQFDKFQHLKPGNVRLRDKAVIGSNSPSSVILFPTTMEAAITVGFTEGLSFDPRRPNWDGDGPRPLHWFAWYPAVDTLPGKVSSERTWFQAGPIARDACLRPSHNAYPLVLLSHGTGGIAAGLEWLAHPLASSGFVVLAMNHHGNTGSEPQRAEGFLCLWERAADLTALLDDQGWRTRLKGDFKKQAAIAGFSAGAYTAMLLMGARVAYTQFEAGNPEKSPIRGPIEFPNLADEIPTLLNRSEVFRDSWERRSDHYADDRMKSALVLAPGRSIRGFSKKSLHHIKSPIQIITGESDLIAPVEHCASWLHNELPISNLQILEAGVGHYTFLPEPSPLGLKEAPDVFVDGAGVNRRAIHEAVSSTAVDFFTKTLSH
ncbi:MAG: alpha/beta fold hydrolase [Pseudomonadota bacterium]